MFGLFLVSKSGSSDSVLKLTNKSNKSSLQQKNLKSLILINNISQSLILYFVPGMKLQYTIFFGFFFLMFNSWDAS